MDILFNDRLYNGSFTEDELIINNKDKWNVIDFINNDLYVIKNSITQDTKCMRIFPNLIKVYNHIEKIMEYNNFKDCNNDQILDMIKKYSYVLTMNDRKFNIFKNTCESYMNFCPNRFDGLPDKTAVLSCGNNHQRMIKMAKDNNFPFIIIFEDDAVGQLDSISKLISYIKDIPVDCDVLALGGVGRYLAKQIHLYPDENKQYYILQSGIVWGSQAYICFRRGYNNIINNLNKNKIADHSIFHMYRNNIYRIDETLFIQTYVPDCNYIHIRKNIGKEIVYWYRDEKRNQPKPYKENPPENFAKIIL